MLLEAAIASAFAITALTVYAKIMNRQLEMSRRARDLDLIEAVVNQDINAIRHQSRLWNMARGPYSDKFPIKMDKANVVVYFQTNCDAWDSKGKLDRSFRSDLGLYSKLVPGGTDIRDSKLISTVRGYRIFRSYSTPVVNLTSEGSISPAANHAAQTMRVAYTISLDPALAKNYPVGFRPLSFERTADIQVPVGLFC
jgi:hypothetical protein